MLACLSADALRPGVAPMADAPVPFPLSPALEMLFGTVHELVLKLETAPEGHATLRDIGLVIGRVLDLLEEDQAILGAADHLYEAAFALQDIKDKRPRSARVTEQAVEIRAEALHRALAGFRKSLCSARPNARGQAPGLAS
jgi:hypothetical protein